MEELCGFPTQDSNKCWGLKRAWSLMTVKHECNTANRFETDIDEQREDIILTQCSPCAAWRSKPWPSPASNSAKLCFLEPWRCWWLTRVTGVLSQFDFLRQCKCAKSYNDPKSCFITLSTGVEWDEMSGWDFHSAGKMLPKIRLEQIQRWWNVKPALL